MAAGTGTAGASASARRKASANGNGNAGKKDAAKAKRAVAEVVTPEAVEQKVADFRGRKLRLKELPPTFLWDLSAAGNSIPAYYQLIQQVLEPEGLAAVRDARAEFVGDDDAFSDELFSAVFAEYGLGPGESEASQGY